MNLESLIDSPYEQNIFQAIHLLETMSEANSSDCHPADFVMIGHDGPVRRESLSFKADPSLGFNGIAINKITPKLTNSETTQSWELMIACMGLVGSGGVLPQHYTELVQQRIKARDFALLDFMDMFNHRIISLYYRAWQKYRIALHHGRALRIGKRDTFSSCVDALSGNAYGNPAINYYAGFFSSEIKSATSLQSMLSDYLAVDVAVEQFVGQWLAIEEDEQSRFDATRKDLACLGQGILLGRKFWSVQNKIGIKIGPVNFQQYQALLPGQRLHHLVTQLIKQYVDSNISVAISLWMNESGRKVSQLSTQGTKLGQSSWLGRGNDQLVEDNVEYVSFSV